jgi:hypothetical protein
MLFADQPSISVGRMRMASSRWSGQAGGTVCTRKQLMDSAVLLITVTLILIAGVTAGMCARTWSDRRRRRVRVPVDPVR